MYLKYLSISTNVLGPMSATCSLVRYYTDCLVATVCFTIESHNRIEGIPDDC